MAKGERGPRTAVRTRAEAAEAALAAFRAETAALIGGLADVLAETPPGPGGFDEAAHAWAQRARAFAEAHGD